MSKVIFKMTFKHPNFKDTPEKNVGHLHYIATRSGVDKTITSADLQKELEKGIDDISSDDQTYLRYIDERPRSHGLFGEGGIEDPKEVQEELRNTNGFVWRGIVSLREEDARKLGYLDKEKWQDMLRKTMPDLAAEMGIGLTNFRWVAAIHMEKDHPHAHVMYWEKTPERTTGIVRAKSLGNLRKLFTDEIFEDERLQLLTEKDAMRDLIRELASDDISKASNLLKDLRTSGDELDSLFGLTQEQSLAPKLYKEEELELAEKIKALAGILPGKGRVALKFMPQDVKDEVGAIADFILQRPGFAALLERNLKTAAELARMYTGHEDDIEKARANAYKDIRNRISQIILKGAVEFQKDNLFHVDDELSQQAVTFITHLDRPINVLPELAEVFKRVATSLARTGATPDQVSVALQLYLDNENLSYPESLCLLDGILQQVFDESTPFPDTTLSPMKQFDSTLAALKLSGADEAEAFAQLRDIVRQDSQALAKTFDTLGEKGFVTLEGETYKLTDKGIEDLLRSKSLSAAEKAILHILEDKSASYEELLDDKDVFTSLRDQDPEEFRVGKYDLKVREEFGDENHLTLAALEARIFAKYTDAADNVTLGKAETEYDIMKNRIDKLATIGYIAFDKVQGAYSFTGEGEAALKAVSDKMEFTRYDANVTLGYIDKAQNGILTVQDLHSTLHKEIVNQAALDDHERFKTLLDQGFNYTGNYLSVDDQGNIRSTEAGYVLRRSLAPLERYFREKATLTEDELEKICYSKAGEDGAQLFRRIHTQLQRQVEAGIILKDRKTGAYTIDPVLKDISRLLDHIHKEGGSVNKSNLLNVLEKNVFNRQAEAQYHYLIRRLDNLKKEGYLTGQSGEYALTSRGTEKRADLLVPQRTLLRKNLGYLQRLDLIQKVDGRYQASERYYKFMKNVAQAHLSKVSRTSSFLDKGIVSLIERTQDNVNIGKLRHSQERMLRGRYLKGEYQDIQTDYESIRKAVNVEDITAKTVNNLATTLLVSGLSTEETLSVLETWNSRTGSIIPPSQLQALVTRASKVVDEDRQWNRVTLISKKDWKAAFEALGIMESDMPKWIYRGENWQSVTRGVGLGSLVHNFWKAVWGELEKQRTQTEFYASMLRKQLAKQAALENKAARVEQISKLRQGSLYSEDELDR